MDSLSELLSVSLASGSLLAILLAYLGGVLTSATPCVYPMIPITVGVIGSSDTGDSRFRSFLNSLIYVFGLAVVYSALGVVAAATGSLFGQISTNPWGYFLVANLCFLFSLWMMEWPPFPRLAFRSKGGKTEKGGRLRIFLMGAASGLVAGPCTAPVLASLLAFVAASGRIVYGGVLLFAFSFGLGTLLIAVGTFSGLAASLPRSGEWMVRVKKVLALLIFAAGEYFLIQMGMLMF